MDRKGKIMLLKVFLGFVVFVSLFSFATVRHNNRTLGALNLNLDQESGVRFIKEESLINELGSKFENLNSTSIKELNIKEIEAVLESNPFVKSAEVYQEIEGNLAIQIVQETPFARVNTGKKEFYIAETLKVMPLSNVYSPDVMMVGGEVHESEFEDLKELILFIKADKLLKKHIVAIKKQAPNSFILLVNKGEYIIEFGDLKNKEEKFDKLKLFYAQYLNKVGLNYYEKINLNFNNQIVATKRKHDEKE